MDEPLTKWYCDVCDKLIEDVNGGYVVWKRTDQRKSHGFMIIHQGKCDPKKEYTKSKTLNDFLGKNGIVNLLNFLSLRQVKIQASQDSASNDEDTYEFLDFFQRVQIPFYEEARRCFSNHDFIEDNSHKNTEYLYCPQELIDIIVNYKESH